MRLSLAVLFSTYLLTTRVTSVSVSQHVQLIWIFSKAESGLRRMVRRPESDSPKLPDSLWQLAFRLSVTNISLFDAKLRGWMTTISTHTKAISSPKTDGVKLCLAERGRGWSRATAKEGERDSAYVPVKCCRKTLAFLSNMQIISTSFIVCHLNIAFRQIIFEDELASATISATKDHMNRHRFFRMSVYGGTEAQCLLPAEQMHLLWLRECQQITFLNKRIRNVLVVLVFSNIGKLSYTTVFHFLYSIWYYLLSTARYCLVLYMWTL